MRDAVIDKVSVSEVLADTLLDTTTESDEVTLGVRLVLTVLLTEFVYITVGERDGLLEMEGEKMPDGDPVEDSDEEIEVVNVPLTVPVVDMLYEAQALVVTVLLLRIEGDTDTDGDSETDLVSLELLVVEGHADEDAVETSVKELVAVNVVEALFEIEPVPDTLVLVD